MAAAGRPEAGPGRAGPGVNANGQQENTSSRLVHPPREPDAARTGCPTDECRRA